MFIIALILLGTTNSKAILQANPTTHKSPATKNGATWLTEIRQMETAGQTMGLTETLNGLNATSASNGIDVHMMLPTEFGAVAILSASGYGNPKKLLEEPDAQKRTTTGNSTGVYFTGDRWEYTASSGTGIYVRTNSRTSSAIFAILWVVLVGTVVLTLELSRIKLDSLVFIGFRPITKILVTALWQVEWVFSVLVTPGTTRMVLTGRNLGMIHLEEQQQ